jgi:hypothetical protein
MHICPRPYLNCTLAPSPTYLFLLCLIVLSYAYLPSPHSNFVGRNGLLDSFVQRGTLPLVQRPYEGYSEAVWGLEPFVAGAGVNWF